MYAFVDLLQILGGGKLLRRNRKFKNDVFCMLASEPQYALDIYNALNGSSYSDVKRVEIRKLHRGIELSVRNDASCIINSVLNMWEHQSTYNPNMPVRSLIYTTEAIKDIADKNGLDIYGRRRIPIPNPKIVVFYNGKEERPDIEVMKLSDSYIALKGEPDVELKCTIYNINKGHNSEILSRSKVLSGYAYFVDKVTSYAESGYDNGEAIRMAIEECISKNILREFFTKRRKEVQRQMDLDMTWKARIPMIRREAREDGYSEGYKSGEATGISQGISQGKLDDARNMIDDGVPIDKIVRYTGLTREAVENLQK